MGHRIAMAAAVGLFAVAAIAIAPADAATPAGAAAHPSVARGVIAAAAHRGPWPAQGQAAYVLGTAPIHRGPHVHEAPIASVAKVMTALLVLRHDPLPRHGPGFTMVVHRRDVADWHRRVARDESTVPVRLGEHLTERKALQALLLPSANNV
ncbi:MAG: hypothetical protein INR72_17210, partial [Williamsia herbipolensis]|nr:hypothetical protein [Williamsia herbipolensis]